MESVGQVGARTEQARKEQARRPNGKRRRTKKGWFLPTYTALVIAYLFIPVVVMVLFGFNNYQGRFNYTFQGFTLDHYRNLFDFPDLTKALQNSLIIAFASAIVATILGTLVALALTRYRFRGRSTVNLFIFIPMATPEIVLGVALLAFFLQAQDFFEALFGFSFRFGFPTILIAHIVFSISYVVVTVKARTSGLDRNLEDAAQDLGATPWTTFWTVTFPLIFPGILAAGMLAFVLSLDDYVVTVFNAGSTETLPLWVFGASRIGVPAQVNVIGTLIVLIGVGYVIVTLIRGKEPTLTR